MFLLNVLILLNLVHLTLKVNRLIFYLLGGEFFSLKCILCFNKLMICSPSITSGLLTLSAMDAIILLCVIILSSRYSGGCPAKTFLC